MGGIRPDLFRGRITRSITEAECERRARSDNTGPRRQSHRVSFSLHLPKLGYIDPVSDFECCVDGLLSSPVTSKPPDF